MRKIILAFILLLFCVPLFGQTEKSITKEEGIHPFTEGKLQGLKDYGNGQIVLEAKYEKIDNRYPNIFIIREGDKTGVFDIRHMKFMIPIEYNSVKIKGGYDTNAQFTVTNNSHKEGYIDHDYNIILEPEYNRIYVSRDQLIFKKDTLWGVKFLNERGQDIPMIYNTLIPYGSVFLGYHSDKKFTLFDEQGKPILENYQLIKLFSGKWESSLNWDYFIIKDEANQEGIYSEASRQMIIPVSYTAIVDRFLDFYIVKKNGKIGAVDQNNNIKIPFEYDTISFLKPLNDAGAFRWNKEKYKNTLLLVSQKGKFGLMNRAGEKITAIEYDEVDHIYGYYKAKKGNQYFVLNPLGNKITKLSFDEVGHFYEDKCAVFKKGKIGYLKNDGTLVENFERTLVPKGHKTIEALYKQFVLALKAEDDKALEIFSRAISVDQYTIEFMDRIGWLYRDISNQNIPLDDLSRKYYDVFLSFKYKLKAKGELESLEFIRYENPFLGMPYSLFTPSYGILIFNEGGILKTKNGTIDCKLGILFNIDGYWKSFRVPHQL